MTEATSTTSAAPTDAGVQTTAAEGVNTEGQVAAGETTTTTAEAPAAEAAAVDYTLAAPEGMELDSTQVEEFTAIAKELKLPKEAAQRIADIAIKRAQAEATAHAEMVNGWADTVKADKEIGGDKLAETLTVAKKALALGPPELQELLNSSGMGNHPAVVKWAYAIGKALSEDKFVPGSQPAGGVKETSKVLYPNNA